MPLTDTLIRKSKPAETDYNLYDGKGLYVQVRASGKKVFLIRFYIKGKAGLFTVGEYPSTTLAEARKVLQDIKLLAKDGINPNQHKRNQEQSALAENEPSTFYEIAQLWLKEKIQPKSERYYNRMQRIVEVELKPRIGNKPLIEIGSADIYKIMELVADRGTTDAANDVRRCAGRIVRYAIRTAKVQNYQDPTLVLGGAITHNRINGSRALSMEEVANLFARLASNKSKVLVIAIQLLAYTFVRSIELRRGEWSEIDWLKKEWHIPAEKMKNKLPHIVPLSSQVVTLFRELYSLTGYSHLFLPNRIDASRPIAESTLNNGIKNMGFNISCHDFRTTAKTWLSEHEVPDYLTERQLSHVEGRLKRTYNKALYLTQRHQMMQQWADMLDHLKK